MRTVTATLLALALTLALGGPARANNWTWLNEPGVSNVGRQAATTLRQQLERTLPSDFLVASTAVLSRDLLVAILCRGVAQLDIKQLQALQQNTASLTSAADAGKLVRKVLGALGPGFIKFGQLLGNRPDLVGARHREQLTKLSDEAPKIDYALMSRQLTGALDSDKATKRMLHRLFRKRRDRVFKTIDKDPVGVGSIGQVYRAQLFTGEEVFVKLLKPDVAKQLDGNFGVIAAALAARPSAAPLAQLVAEQRNLARAEVDLAHEAREIARGARMLRRLGIRTPEVIGSLSNSHILVMKRVQGDKITKTRFRDEDTRKQSARLLLASVALPLLVYGRFHADPHEGNVFATPDGDMSLIDWGLTGTISFGERRRLVQLIAALARGKEQSVQRALSGLPGYDEKKQSAAIKRRLAQKGSALKRLQSLLLDLQMGGIQLPASLITASKALLLAEGVARALDPSLSMSGMVEAVVQHFKWPTLRRANEKSIDPVMKAYVAKLRQDKAEQSKLVQQHHELRVGGLEKKLTAARERLAYEQQQQAGLVVASKPQRKSLWRRIWGGKKGQTPVAATPPPKVDPVWQSTSKTIADLERSLHSAKNDYNHQRARRELELTKLELSEHTGAAGAISKTGRKALRKATRWLGRVRLPLLRRK